MGQNDTETSDNVVYYFVALKIDLTDDNGNLLGLRSTLTDDGSSTPKYVVYVVF